MRYARFEPRFPSLPCALVCIGVCVAVCITACTTTGVVPRTDVATGKAPDARAPADPITALNARAKAGGVVESIHGMTVADPYRSLEQHSELTDAWIEAQTDRTERALAALRNPARDERLFQLLSIGSIGEIALGGSRVFATVREGTREQAALYVLENIPPAGEQAALGVPLLDPLSFGERASIDYFFPSPSGKRVAIGISHSGDERSVLQIIDVASRALLSERIEHAKWSAVAWLNDESGFYYTRYPAEGEPRYNADEPDTYFPAVLFHRIGSELSRDVRVWSSQVATDFPFPVVSDDDRYVVLHNQRTWTATDVQLFDRGAKPSARVLAPDAAHPLVPVLMGADREAIGTIHHGRLFLLTNLNADRKRIVSVPLAHPSDQSAWRDLVPEGPGTIESWTLANDQIAVHTVQDVRSQLALFDLDGKLISSIAMPTAGSIESLASDPKTGALAYLFSSFFYPPALFARATMSEEPSIRHQVTHDLDLSAYEVTQAKVASADGTLIPLYAVHKKGLAHDGQAPVLLTGYGGFNVSLLPDFTRNAIYWLERGGVYVVANLRGGAEYGESWHRSGMLENKPHVFEDFEAVLRWLSTSRISNPQRIAIIGGSNGGLLMGAAITRAPALFAAAVAQVGLYDMLRYPLFPPAALWITEYGDPREAKAAQWLHAYSPYHRVVDGTHYPAVMIETADRDTRVHWAHSTKLTARLQEAQAGSRPIYFYMEHEQGHGSGTRLRDLVEQYSRYYAFIEHELNLR